MKGQRRGRYSQLLAYGSGRQSRRTLLYQQAKDTQARFLRQSSQRFDGGFIFHNSKIIKLLAMCQPAGIACLSWYKKGVGSFR